MEYSCGVIAYKYEQGVLKVMLTHPGGPFWFGTDLGSWGIPKGHKEDGETDFETACREFKEETGFTVQSDTICLGKIKQNKTKYVTAYAVEMDIDVTKCKSNTFEQEYPPNSGKIVEFPEIEKAEWFTINEAKEKILKGQLLFIDKLVEALK